MRVTYGLLKLGSLHASLVLDDDVVAWFGSALKRLVRLHVQIPRSFTISSDMAVDNKTRSGIEGSLASAGIDIGIFDLSGIETGVMALAANLLLLVKFRRKRTFQTYNNGHLRMLGSSTIQLVECLDHRLELDI